MANIQRSGIPDGNTRATATQEILRRLKNSSRETQTEVVREILIDYMGELAQGGYSVKWRIKVLAAALTNYIKLWNNEVEGKGYINCPDHITKMKRRAAKLVRNSSWFKRLPKKETNQNQTKKPKNRNRKPNNTDMPKKIESILFCPFTPFSKLRKKLKEEEDKINGQRATCRVKVIERAGP